MAAPAVSGIVALMMDQYESQFGGVTSLPPSLFKAILVQTAQDHQKTRDYPDNEFNNPDLNGKLRFHAGPDFSTGYGLVDAEAARELISLPSRQRIGTIGGTGLVHTYCLNIPKGTREFKVTLAWDDAPGAPNIAMTASKLVNDLDLVLIAPNGASFFPWTIDPLPLNAVPGSGGLDPISQSNITPAYKAADHRNNVELAEVCNPQPGLWKIRIRGFNLPLGTGQKYSMVSSHPVSKFCFLDICALFPWICDGVFTPGITLEPFDKDMFRIDPKFPIPVDDICKYVLNCPGCEGPGWKLCPGFEIVMNKIPQNVKVSLVDQNGSLIIERRPSETDLVLPVPDFKPHDQFFLIFSDFENRPLKESLELGIQLRN